MILGLASGACRAAKITVSRTAILSCVQRSIGTLIAASDEGHGVAAKCFRARLHFEVS